MKYKLTVLYGEEACDYADEHRGYIQAAIRAIKAGKVFGGHAEYTFDTEEDRETAKLILEDAYGWENNMWETYEE